MKIPYALLLLICFFVGHSQAQISFTVTDSIYEFENVDLSGFVDLSIDNWMSNETPDSLNVRWTFVEGDCPQEWFFTKADENQNYLPSVTSNVDPSGSPDFPVILEPGETNSILNLHIYPDMTPGCCTVSYELSLAENPPTEVLAKATYQVFVNAPPECQAVSTLETTNASIKVYPNPSSGNLQIEAESPIFGITVFSVQGQAFGEISTASDGSYDLSHLPAGIYFLQMKMEGGETEWVKISRI